MQDTPIPQKIVLDSAAVVELRKCVASARAEESAAVAVQIDLFEALIDSLEASLNL